MGAYLSVSIVKNSQSIAGNYSNVTVSATLSWDWGTWNNNAMPGALIIDGTSYPFSTNFNWNGASDSGSKLLITKTVNVYHNGDGSKKLTCSAWFEYHSGKFAEAAASLALPTIARVSQPSCITWPEHTQNVGEFGDTISIHMNRKSDMLTHTVRYQFGSQSGTIATGVENGTTWKIPLSLMNLIPNANSGSGTIYVDTYSGSTKIGTASCGFTATVPDSVKPSCSFVLEDITGIDDIYGSPVQNLSKIKITVNVTKAYGSEIDSYRITVNGVTYTSSPATTGVLLTSGISTVKATVTDKRGRSASVSYDMRVQAYSLPNITKLSVYRSNSDGTANEQGKYVRVKFSAAVSAMNNTNTATYKLKYKKSTDAEYTTVSFSTLNNVYSVTDQIYIFAADDGSSYVVELEVTDKHHTAMRSTTASTGFTLMHFGADGKSIGIGKVAEKTNTLEVALDTEHTGNLITKGNRFVLSSPGVAESTGYVRMASIGFTAANADTPFTFVFTRRRAETPMTVHVLFLNPTATASSLKSITYEGSNYGAFLVQSSELSWDLYVEKLNEWDTIVLQDWWVANKTDQRTTITFPGDFVSSLPGEYYRATPAKLESLIDFIFPVGCIQILYSHVSPAELYGGTWSRISNAFLWATTSGGTIGQTGGEQTHTLTVDEIPSHDHSISVAHTLQGSTSAMNTIRYNNDPSDYPGALKTAKVGGGKAHNNMPPYVQVSVWRRTA